MAFLVLKLLIRFGEKLQPYEPPIIAAKCCRVCLEEEENGEGEETWVAPCRCSHTIAWVHRSCLAWRLKHTVIDEAKRRCVVCKYTYQKCVRFKSPREWFDGWKEDWPHWVLLIAGEVLRSLSRHYIRHIRQQADALNMWDNPGFLQWYYKRCVTIFILRNELLAFLEHHLRAHFHFPDAGLLNFKIWKRILSVAAYDWVLDAPPPDAYNTPRRTSSRR